MTKCDRLVSFRAHTHCDVEAETWKRTPTDNLQKSLSAIRRYEKMFITNQKCKLKQVDAGDIGQW